jgi:putative glutamine amidotransferase
LDYFGCELTDVKGHVAVRHRLLGTFGGLEVNSFHNQALVKKGDFAGNGDVLEILAYTDDGVVEAVHHKKYKILATMWHPEREEIFRDDDIKRVQNLFAEER